MESSKGTLLLGSASGVGCLRGQEDVRTGAEGPRPLTYPGRTLPP